MRLRAESRDGDFFHGAAGFLLSFAIRHIGSGNVSLIGSIGPVSTIYLAFVILDETISVLQIAGSVLVMVMGGVLVISLNSKPEAG